MIAEVRPNQGRADLPNEINIYGANFAEAAVVHLGSSRLEVTYISGAQLRATVPAGLEVGVYSLDVTNPDGGSARMNDAYTVFDAANDDLFGYGYELWVEPVAPHADSEATIGLIVHRQGGKQPLNNVVVRFYLGDPHTVGTPLGDGVILLLSPRSSGSTPGVAWKPPTGGDYELYAVIDPDGAIPEEREDNNEIQRIVSVLPPLPDAVAPHVDTFTLNDGSPTTSSRDVRLNTTASDPSPSSGLASLLFIEYEYSQGANQWTPVYASDWLSYDTTHANYPWKLLPSAGVKYLQAWAADNAGNISTFPYKAFVNYIPPTDRVGVNQGRIYRYQLEVGQQLMVQVDPVAGDPDLYIWAPDYSTRPPWVSNLSNGTEQISFVAPISGVYQIEIYGFTSAEYRLEVDIAAADAVGAEQVATGVDDTKPVPSQPLVLITSEPGARYSLSAPQVELKLYLPVVNR